jgi:hypothetical protein
MAKTGLLVENRAYFGCNSFSYILLFYWFKIINYAILNSEITVAVPMSLVMAYLPE